MTMARSAIGRLGALLRDRRAYGLCAPALTLLGAGTAALAPAILSPADFGQYILVSGLFQYAAHLDFGLSSLTDRSLALPMPDRSPWSIADLLWSRGIVFVVGMIAASALLIATHIHIEASVLLAMIGGMAFMLSDGAVAVFRSSGQIGSFTACALTMQLGMGLPRLAGLLLGGVVGAFLALSTWYVATAGIFAVLLVPQLTWQPSLRRVARILREAVPLFSLTTLWWFYILSARVIAAFFLPASDLGKLGIGLTLIGMMNGLIGTIAQVHYPKYLAVMDLGRFSKDFVLLILLLAGAAATGMTAVRFLLPFLLPRYDGGLASAGILLIAAVPLCLCSWLMPIVTATSRKPIRDGLIIFGISEAFLFAAMAAGSVSGLSGIAWGILLSTIQLLVCLVIALHRLFILPRQIWQVIGGVGGGLVGFGILEWLLLFGEVRLT